MNLRIWAELLGGALVATIGMIMGGFMGIALIFIGIGIATRPIWGKKRKNTES